MKTQLLGRTAFYLTWPALAVYLYHSQRTRILVICGDEVLLLRGWLSSGRWGLPGGGLHKTEAPEVGARREAAEEVGLQLESSQLHPLGQFTADEHGFHFTYYAFVVRLSKKPVITHQRLEISASKWVPLNHIDSLPTEQIVRHVIDSWRTQE